MMARIYVDAGPLIEMAQHRAAPSGTGLTVGVWYCRQALRAARESALFVTTSILSISECTSIAAGLPTPPEDVKRFYNALLISGKSGIKLYGHTQSIAVRARDLRWTSGINLKGADAVHVATALQAGCHELWTRDAGIWKKKDQIETMGIKVVYPERSTLVPAQYLTPDMFTAT